MIHAIIPGPPQGKGHPRASRGRHAIPAPENPALSTAMLVLERELQANVKEMAQLLGWKIYHTWLSVKSVAGYPDMTMVHPGQGRILWAELKRENGKIRANQTEWLETLRAAGQEAYLWRPSDLLNGSIEKVLKAKP